jgi:rhamnulokinase
MADTALRVVALDLGAESGRAVEGRFDGERLSIADLHRFPNVPVAIGGTLYWDVLRLFGDIAAGLRRAAAGGPVRSVAVNSWGVDFGLLDAHGRLLANPVHYRDARTLGMVEVATAVVPKADIYATTGIQFMPINTLYQLLVMARADDPLLAHAERLLMLADLFSHFLSGSDVTEYTLATTSQCLDAQTRDWARPLFERLGIPTHFLPAIVEPGTSLGPLLPGLAADTGLSDTIVIAGSHDTASAVLGAPLRGPTTAYLSSGTWSLLGVEVPAPVINERSLAANLTNEGGVAGTIRLLVNVMGLWLVQESRRALWSPEEAPSYEDLLVMAEAAPGSTAFVDPDDVRFLTRGDMPGRVRDFCLETGQPAPPDAGTLVRVLLESLALRYADVIDEITRATGQPIESIHIVGGGSKHRLLCQMTADACRLPVRSGPVEATAIGNVVIQAIAAGELDGVAQARELVARSFPVITYEPAADRSEARARFGAMMAERRSRAAEGVS